MSRVLLAVLLALCVPGAALAATTIRASVEPATVHLGDPFRYTVVARVPGAPGSSLRVVADSGPFVRVSGPDVSRRPVKGATEVTVTETLVCLDLGCVSGATARRVVLPAPQILVGAARAGGSHTTVTVTPRVPAHAVSAGRAAYLRDTSAPALTPRVRLGVGAGVASVLALLLAAAAVALVAAEVRRRATPAVRVRRALPGPRRGTAPAARIGETTGARSSPGGRPRGATRRARGRRRGNACRLGSPSSGAGRRRVTRCGRRTDRGPRG